MDIEQHVVVSFFFRFWKGLEVERKFLFEFGRILKIFYEFGSKNLLEIFCNLSLTVVELFIFLDTFSNV